MGDSLDIKLPRVVITYCTQCRWMLRAAYSAQELLSTFSTAIGEIALTPSTGGIFTVYLTHAADPESSSGHALSATKSILVWDRKLEGGFPETKVLKQRIRDYIEPNRDLGHSDRHGKSKTVPSEAAAPNEAAAPGIKHDPQKEKVEVAERDPDGSACKDCE